MNKARSRYATRNMPPFLIEQIQAMEFNPEYAEDIENAASMQWIGKVGSSKLLKLARHPDRAVKVSLLIAAKSLPNKVFLILSKSKDALVEACTVHHDQCPKKVLDRLAEVSEDEHVREVARQKVETIENGQTGRRPIRQGIKPRFSKKRYA